MIVLAPIVENYVQELINSGKISIELDWWGTPISYSMPKGFESDAEKFIDSIDDAYLEDQI